MKEHKIVWRPEMIIGQLKASVVKNCSICGCKRKMSIAVNILENTQEEKEAAKKTIKEKASKEYTCKICKSIVADIKK